LRDARATPCSRRFASLRGSASHSGFARLSLTVRALELGAGIVAARRARLDARKKLSAARPLQGTSAW